MAALCLLATGAAVQAETPKRGGTLNFAVVAEPPSTDCRWQSAGPYWEVPP
jgi:hypothetical protein